MAEQLDKASDLMRNLLGFQEVGIDTIGRYFHWTNICRACLLPIFPH